MFLFETLDFIPANNIPAKLYHTENPYNRELVYKRGLVPCVGSSYECHYDELNLPAVIFLSDTPYDSTYDDDIWEIDTNSLDKDCIYNDFDTDMDGCFVYTKRIKPASLTLYYEGEETKDRASEEWYTGDLNEAVYGRHRVNNPDDEFYTRYVDCEKEYKYYDFTNKAVYCCCDDPSFSLIYKYFHDNFDVLKLKKLISTYYGDNGYITTYDGIEEIQEENPSDGSFDSTVSKELMRQADIVVTNPPFGRLVIKFINQVMQMNKDFIAVVPYTVVTNPSVGEYFKQGKLLSGHNYIHLFTRPDGSTKGAPVFWLTNINNHDHAPLKRVAPRVIKSDEGYNVVNTYRSLPLKFEGEMIVPMSYIAYYNPDEFEFIDDIQYRLNGVIKHGIIIRLR